MKQFSSLASRLMAVGWPLILAIAGASSAVWIAVAKAQGLTTSTNSNQARIVIVLPHTGVQPFNIHHIRFHLELQ
jgi:hypothetical protein